MSFLRIISMHIIQKLEIQFYTSFRYTKNLQIEVVLLCYKDVPHTVSNKT